MLLHVLATSKVRPFFFFPHSYPIYTPLTDDDINVQLPGTHGTIFQWDPPHFGISKEVLQELVDELKKEVVRLAVEAANESQSALCFARSFMGLSIPISTPDDPQP